MPKIYVKLPKSLKEILIKHPNLFSRLLLLHKNDTYRAVGWSSGEFLNIVRIWKQYTNMPLRLIPKRPKEGGSTQMTWNKAWDNSQPLINNLRILRD